MQCDRPSASLASPTASSASSSFTHHHCEDAHLGQYVYNGGYMRRGNEALLSAHHESGWHTRKPAASVVSATRPAWDSSVYAVGSGRFAIGHVDCSAQSLRKLDRIAHAHIVEVH